MLLFGEASGLDSADYAGAPVSRFAPVIELANSLVAAALSTGLLRLEQRLCYSLSLQVGAAELALRLHSSVLLAPNTRAVYGAGRLKKHADKLLRRLYAYSSSRQDFSVSWQVESWLKAVFHSYLAVAMHVARFAVAMPVVSLTMAPR